MGVAAMPSLAFFFQLLLFCVHATINAYLLVACFLNFVKVFSVNSTSLDRSIQAKVFQTIANYVLFYRDTIKLGIPVISSIDGS